MAGAGPCRMLAPVVDDFATEYEGQVKVVKLNADQNPTVASHYGIRSIPTLMVFKSGRQVDTVVGAVSKTTLAKVLHTVYFCLIWDFATNSSLCSGLTVNR